MEAEEGQLSEFLLDSGLLSRSQLDATLKGANGKPLSQALIESGVLSEEEVRRASAHALGIPYVVLSRDDIDPTALFLIPESLSRTHSAAAFRVSEQGVEVALLDMADLSALSFLEERMKILPRLTSRESLRRALLIYQKRLKERFGSALEGAQGGSEALTALLSHALSQHASSIHLEPQKEGMRVRYRIDAILREAMSLSKKTGGLVASHLKERANLEMSEVLPQEARLKIAHEDEMLPLRVATLPTSEGEKLVLDLIPQGRKGFSLESLGLHGEALEFIHQALRQKSGLIIIAGKAHSGTTTTLYTLLDMLNRPTLSLASIEEEVEYRLPHVAQTAAAPKLGLSTAAALRAALRQDPDVVAVKVGDTDTALLAAQAGRRRLVLAEVEAPSAAAALQQLLSLGVSEELLSSVLCAVLGQRLVPRLCKHYREEHRLSRAESEAFEHTADFGRVLAALKEEGVVSKTISWKDVPFFRAEGCAQCQQGYQGLVGMFEILGSDTAPAGLTLAEDALFKAAQGLTSIEQVLLGVEK